MDIHLPCFFVSYGLEGLRMSFSRQVHWCEVAVAAQLSLVTIIVVGCKAPVTELSLVNEN